MNKKSLNSKLILDYIGKNSWVSSTEIGRYANMTTVSAYGYLNNLLSNNLIYKQWNGKNTRYYILNNEIEFSDSKFVEPAIKLLIEDYEISISEKEIIDILNNNFCYINSLNWQLSYSLKAFISWCKDPKRNFKEEIIVEELARYIVNYLDIERLRRKSSFFDWTESMRKILSEYTEISLDKVMFYNISEISWFGRTRTAIELYYWKQNSDKFLLKNAIESSILPIREYVAKNNIDTIIFTPPTIARPVQFSDILKDKLDLWLKEISVTKVRAPDRTLIAQKFTKWIERITNADSSINVYNIDNIDKIWHILILDDNFTTGATINAIAKKIRFLWYKNKITAITIAWKFHYDAIIDMDEI